MRLDKPGEVLQARGFCLHFGVCALCSVSGWSAQVDVSSPCQLSGLPIGCKLSQARRSGLEVREDVLRAVPFTRGSTPVLSA